MPKIVIQSPVLPPEPEVEVVYRSWDPPSGSFYLHLEAEVTAGEWVPVTFGQIARSEDRVMKCQDLIDEPFSWRDGPEGLAMIQRKALNYARWGNVPTRVVRKQALL